MSLINDALRRATKENDKREANELPAMQPTFKTVRTGGPGFSIFVVCFLLAAGLTLGAWFYYKRGMGAPAAKPAAKPTLTTNNNPLARASQTLGAVENLNKDGESAADNMRAGVGAAVSATATKLESPHVDFPEGRTGPKLQGIFYSANNASAIINGKMVKVGDEVDGVKVVAITQQAVRVESGGQARELRMK